MEGWGLSSLEPRQSSLDVSMGRAWLKSWTGNRSDAPVSGRCPGTHFSPTHGQGSSKES